MATNDDAASQRGNAATWLMRRIPVVVVVAALSASGCGNEGTGSRRPSKRPHVFPPKKRTVPDTVSLDHSKKRKKPIKGEKPKTRKKRVRPPDAKVYIVTVRTVEVSPVKANGKELRLWDAALGPLGVGSRYDHPDLQLMVVHGDQVDHWKEVLIASADRYTEMERQIRKKFPSAARPKGPNPEYQKAMRHAIATDAELVKLRDELRKVRFESKIAHDTLVAMLNSEVATVAAGESLKLRVQDIDWAAHDMIGEVDVTITPAMLEQGTADLAFGRVTSCQLAFHETPGDGLPPRPPAAEERGEGEYVVNLAQVEVKPEKADGQQWDPSGLPRKLARLPDLSVTILRAADMPQWEKLSQAMLDRQRRVAQTAEWVDTLDKVPAEEVAMANDAELKKLRKALQQMRFESLVTRDTLRPEFDYNALRVRLGESLRVLVIDKDGSCFDDLRQHDIVGQTDVIVTKEIVEKGEVTLSFGQVNSCKLRFRPLRKPKEAGGI